MTTKEIEKAVEEYAESLKSMSSKTLVGRVMPYALKGAFKEGLESANKYWQERTRWKSLIAEPPTDYGKRYFFRTESNREPFCMPFLNKNSIDEYIDYGFIEWKEIE